MPLLDQFQSLGKPLIVIVDFSRPLDAFMRSVIPAEVDARKHRDQDSRKWIYGTAREAISTSAQALSRAPFPYCRLLANSYEHFLISESKS